MIAVITGDIINSRKNANRQKWLPVLKYVFNKYGQTPADWEIFRGDSFQLKIKQAPQALRICLHIKAALKTLKDKDVRMAIGLGTEDAPAKKITEANGSAYVYSGELFEKLKFRKLNLAVKSADENFDYSLNLLLQLAAITMDKWSVSSAEIVQQLLENPHLPQTELAAAMGRSQSSISERQSRAQYDLIMEVVKYFETAVAAMENTAASKK
jgi:hypothetical protein